MSGFEEFVLRYRDTEMLHHACLFFGDIDELEDRCLKFLAEDLGIPVAGNPDFFHATYESFGVDESRAVHRWHSVRAFGNGKRVCLIKTMSFSSEAQNSLLKMFEEPGENTHFMVIVPHEELILPTLRSRFLFIGDLRSIPSALPQPSVAGVISPEMFLKASPGERLDLLKKIIGDKNRGSAARFLYGLEREVALFAESGRTPALLEAWSAVVQGKRYLAARGSSLKVILEHLALALPRIS